MDLLILFGSFLSNLIVINFNSKSKYFAHAMPIVLEIMCLLFVGIYGQFYYQKTLEETEYLVALMLFATGLQNGLTASISNFSIKTTHLTGTTTDLGILFSMFTHKNTEKSGAYCQSESIVKHYDCLCSRSCILRTYLLLSGVQSILCDRLMSSSCNWIRCL